MLFSCRKDFPVYTWQSGSNKPVIFYISGDAGFSRFSKKLSSNLHGYGYDVFTLDSKTYFWRKKTPEQTSKDIAKFLQKTIKNRPNKKIILMGFSFGCDVLPTVYNLFPQDLKKNVEKIILIGPSKTAEFEVHLENYLVREPEGTFETFPEINKIGDKPVIMIMSNYEVQHFPYKEVKLKNFRYVHVNGDHHYSNNTPMLAKIINTYLNN